ncbi:DUF302 domain-containing protein [Rhodopila globiformis]|uniref:DUF302 domain-containing protein n=1 Tax=Rhodopila globiformis TaxID=1071 RepID=A0A2S6NLA6_RHOGL|nr:DUF302 domain-containing protein [Rhodopila globiformis]PPQ36052.1 hypothetical protein CCS01_05905 [Rhodopila globiformis]
MTDAAQPDIVEHVSSTDFASTVERIANAITAAGLTLFARIDHAAGAREAGLAMPPATVLIYGHAKGGTPVMLAAPATALDLPLRVLVRQREDGQAVIAFHPVAAMLRRAGVAPDLAARLEPAQHLLIKAVAQ